MSNSQSHRRPRLSRPAAPGIACPTCSAAADHPCMRYDGKVRQFAHPARKAAAMGTTPPKVENAPGLVWKPLRAVGRWRCFWQARSDLVAKGYRPKVYRLWFGLEPTAAERAMIADACNRQQAEMLAWARAGAKPIGIAKFNGTLGGLIDAYQVDKDSSYRNLRHATRVNQDGMLRRLDAAYGNTRVADINARTVKDWHRGWSEGGKVHMAHGFVGLLRTLISFGMTILEDKECTRLSAVLSKLRFKMGAARTQIITPDQVAAVRRMAHVMHHQSIALAQALQFECMLRQKDVIGEWVPISEPGLSDLTSGNEKWLYGLQWQEIDDNLVLLHTTSKRLKPLEVDLKLSPMVLEEFARAFHMEGIDRSKLPASGPVIVYERTLLPYNANQFRYIWRTVAKAAGIPNNVYNMDSRAGAITEATNAGAELEHVRHAATHSDIAMTQRYSRAGAEKTATVQRLRVDDRRNKSGSS